jgi:hypothetical protein
MPEIYQMQILANLKQTKALCSHRSNASSNLNFFKFLKETRANHVL